MTHFTLPDFLKHKGSQLKDCVVRMCSGLTGGGLNDTKFWLGGLCMGHRESSVSRCRFCGKSFDTFILVEIVSL